MRARDGPPNHKPFRLVICEVWQNHVFAKPIDARGRKLANAEKLMNRVTGGIRGKVERAFGTLKKAAFMTN